MTTILSTQHLSYTHAGGTDYALKDINLEIEEGDFTLIAGPTGSGKSTLALCLTGLIPQVIGGEMKGRVVVDGRDTKHYEVYQMAQFIGLVFQNAENQLCSLDVEGEISFGPENLGLPRAEIERRVKNALKAVNLDDLRRKYTFNLSGGEKHKTVIASSLSMLPKILVLDEPFSELDPVGCREILLTLKRLNEEYGITVILIEHKLEHVLGFAKSAMLLKDGEIVASGPTSEVFKQGRLDEWLDLRVPEALKLSQELVKRGIMPNLALTTDEFEASMPTSAFAHASQKSSNPFSRTWQGEKTGSDNAVIRVEGLSYSYFDGTPALKDVNIRIVPGEFITILGSNGAGKTTLARLMAGQLKSAKGKIYLKGEDVTKQGKADLARVVGYTFQNPDCQLFCKTVRDEIAFGPRHLNLEKEEVEARVENTLRMMQLEQFKDRDPQTLSRGQKIGVAVASVLAMKPEVLVLDEPTLGQDFRRIRSLVRMLKSMSSGGLALVVITHDVNFAAEHSSRVVIMKDGIILLDGEPHAILSQEDVLRSANLEPPASVRLSRVMGLPPMLTVDEIIKTIWGSSEVNG
jgi:energy-coupling factor transport system ATP-binding protein